jgi:DNA-binding transcriptional regulator GbsR (MarR family)
VKKEKSEDIKKAIEEAVANLGQDGSEAAEKILKTLDKQKILRYHQENEVSLLSTSGRVLVAIIEDPTMTIRAISVYLDLSETMIDKTVKSLISAGLITKTKVNRQNVYQLNKNLILEQPDIQHFWGAIAQVGEKNTDQSQLDADIF